MALVNGGSYNSRAFASQEFGMHLRALLQPGNARAAAEGAARATFDHRSRALKMLDLSPMLDELDADCVTECNIRWYLSEVSRVACAIGCLHVFETYRSAWEILKTFFPTSLGSALSELVELTRYVPLFDTLTAEDLSKIDFHVLDRQKMISLIRPGRHHYNASYKSAFLGSFENTQEVDEACSSACVWLDNIRMLECAPVDLSVVFRSAYQFILDYESSPAQSEADAGQAAFIHALEAVQRSCIFLDIVQPKKVLQIVHQHFLPDFSAAAKACTQVCTQLPVASDTNVAPRVRVYLQEYLAAFRRSASPTAAHHEAVEKTTEIHQKQRGIGLVRCCQDRTVTGLHKRTPVEQKIIQATWDTLFERHVLDGELFVTAASLAREAVSSIYPDLVLISATPLALFQRFWAQASSKPGAEDLVERALCEVSGSMGIVSPTSTIKVMFRVLRSQNAPLDKTWRNIHKALLLLPWVLKPGCEEKLETVVKAYTKYCGEALRKEHNPFEASQKADLILARMFFDQQSLRVVSPKVEAEYLTFLEHTIRSRRVGLMQFHEDAMALLPPETRFVDLSYIVDRVCSGRDTQRQLLIFRRALQALDCIDILPAAREFISQYYGCGSIFPVKLLRVFFCKVPVLIDHNVPVEHLEGLLLVAFIKAYDATFNYELACNQACEIVALSKNACGADLCWQSPVAQEFHRVFNLVFKKTGCPKTGSKIANDAVKELCEFIGIPVEPPRDLENLFSMLLSNREEKLFSGTEEEAPDEAYRAALTLLGDITDLLGLVMPPAEVVHNRTLVEGMERYPTLPPAIAAATNAVQTCLTALPFDHWAFVYRRPEAILARSTVVSGAVVSAFCEALDRGHELGASYHMFKSALIVAEHCSSNRWGRKRASISQAPALYDGGVMQQLSLGVRRSLEREPDDIEAAFDEGLANIRATTAYLGVADLQVVNLATAFTQSYESFTGTGVDEDFALFLSLKVTERLTEVLNLYSLEALILLVKTSCRPLYEKAVTASRRLPCDLRRSEGSQTRFACRGAQVVSNFCSFVGKHGPVSAFYRASEAAARCELGSKNSSLSYESLIDSRLSEALSRMTCENVREVLDGIPDESTALSAMYKSLVVHFAKSTDSLLVAHSESLKQLGPLMESLDLGYMEQIYARIADCTAQGGGPNVNALMCEYTKESLKKIEDSDGSLQRLYRTFRLLVETLSPAKAVEECALLVGQSAVSTSDSDRN